jgi:hypothetical protein
MDSNLDRDGGNEGECIRGHLFCRNSLFFVHSTTTVPRVHRSKKFMHGLEGRQSAQANEGDLGQRSRYVSIAALISFMPAAFFACVSIASVRDRLIRARSLDNFERPGATGRLMALASDVTGMYQPACRKLQRLRTRNKCEQLAQFICILVRCHEYFEYRSFVALS